jgi:hypothetical protein
MRGMITMAMKDKNYHDIKDLQTLKKGIFYPLFLDSFNTTVSTAQF